MTNLQLHLWLNALDIVQTALHKTNLIKYSESSKYPDVSLFLSLFTASFFPSRRPPFAFRQTSQK